MLAPRRCVRCGFSLAHAHAAHSNACPECGLAFDDPVHERLGDTALWQRLRRAGHLLFATQMLWATIIGVSMVVLIAVGAQHELDGVFNAESMRVIDVVRAAAWMVAAWMLQRDAADATPRRRHFATLSAALFTIALGQQAQRLMMEIVAEDAGRLALGTVVGATAVVLVMLPSRSTRRARWLTRSRLGGRAGLICAIFAAGALGPSSALRVETDVVQLVAAFALLITQCEWSRTLHRERIAAGLALLRPLAYVSMLIALIAILLIPLTPTARTPIVSLLPPAAVWSPLVNTLFLTAVAIGIRALHHSVRTVRRTALEVQTIDQIARERVALRLPQTPIARVDVLSVAIAVIAIACAVSVVYFPTFGSWRFGTAHLGSIITACTIAVILTPVILTRHGLRHSSALRIFSGLGLLLGITVLAVGSEATRWDATGWASLFIQNRWQCAIVGLGTLAGAVAVNPRPSWRAVRLIVATPLLVLCGWAFSTAARFMDVSVVLPTVVGLYAFAGTRVLPWRVAPLRSRRLWYAITCLRWWSSRATLVAGGSFSFHAALRLAHTNHHDWLTWEQWSWLEGLDEQLSGAAFVAMLLGVPVFLALITVAAIRLRRQQRRANLPFPHVGQSQPE